jgi:predicted ribonuclease YlaK
MNIFIDTNTCLYYQPIEKIDFAEFLDADQVKIIIPRILIRKLDKEKNKNNSPNIRIKAKKVLDYFEKTILSKELVSKNISLEYYRETPKINFEKLGLNKDWYDDILIASMIQYRLENPAKEIALIADDSDIRLHASHFHIRAYEMSEKYRLPLEFTYTDMDHIRLKKELGQIKNSISNLFYYFSESENAAAQSVFTGKSTSGFYADRVDVQSRIFDRSHKNTSFQNNLYGQVLSFHQRPAVLADPSYHVKCKKLDEYV